MKEGLLDYRTSQTYSNIILKEVNTFFRRIMSRYYVDTTIFPTMRQNFTAVYSRDKEYLFDLDMPNFFTSATRSRIVQFILDRTKFTQTKEDDFAFGIERLISEHAYVAAYPLHDVSYIFTLIFSRNVFLYKRVRNFLIRLMKVILTF